MKGENRIQYIKSKVKRIIKYMSFNEKEAWSQKKVHHDHEQKKHGLHHMSKRSMLKYLKINMNTKNLI